MGFLDTLRFIKDLGKNWLTNKAVKKWNRLGSHVAEMVG